MAIDRKKSSASRPYAESEDKSTGERIYEIQPSNLENIDIAFFDWVNDSLDIHCTTNEGWKKVPIIWASAERSYQIKHNQELRDNLDALVFPLISIERMSVEKNPTRKGPYYGNIPPQDSDGGAIFATRRIKADKSGKYRNEQEYNSHGALNFRTRKRPESEKKVLYETIFYPMPVHVNIKYALTMKTQYQQQMNEMSQPLMVKTGNINYFTFRRNHHNYEGFFPPDFSLENTTSNMEQEERVYTTKVEIETIGYIYSEDKNSATPKVVVKESVVEVKTPRERVVLGEDFVKEK